jgi:hypothetical protein
MIARCENPKRKGYPYYGGRGITVCERWHDPAAFIADIERDLGPRPPGLTLDRIDNDGNYQPGNVRWATWSEQAFNARRGGLTPAQRAERRAEVARRWQRGETQKQIATALGTTRHIVANDLRALGIVGPQPEAA